MSLSTKSERATRKVLGAHFLFAFLLAVILQLQSSVALSGSDQERNVSGRGELAKVIAALGGAENLTAIKSWKMTGEGVAYDRPATFETIAAAPDLKLVNIKTDLYQVLQGFNGKLAWETQSWVGMQPFAKPKTREIDPAASERVAREAMLIPLLVYWMDKTPVSVSYPHTADGVAPDLVLEFAPQGKPAHKFLIDPNTYLPKQESFSAQYEDGEKNIVLDYGDYRYVGGVYLPFLITENMPLYYGRPLKIRVSSYELNVKTNPSLFNYPYGNKIGRPYDVSLFTAPDHIYKEPDWLAPIEDGWDENPRWGVTFAPTESWVFDLVVDEKWGRWLTPVSAKVEFFSNQKSVGETSFSAQALNAVRRSLVARYSGRLGSSVFRHQFSMPANLNIDRMEYSMNLRAPNGKIVTKKQSLPVSVYKQKTKLIFPLKGNFLILDGHNYDEINHKDELSQWGAYDIVGLGDKMELYDGDEGRNEKFFTFRKSEIISPADGKVVYARNDITDGFPKGINSYAEFDEWAGKLPDPLWAIGGNVVVIDHGNNEFSFFAHMGHGTVRVKKGDHVKQGQVIGLLGASQTDGTPHLHYQLQDGPDIFRPNGLPSRFENLETVVWRSGRKVYYPKYGHYLHAK